MKCQSRFVLESAILAAAIVLTGMPTAARADIFVTDANFNRLIEFTQSGAFVKSVPVGAPTAIAASGTDLFVTTVVDTVSQYSTTGALVNPSLISDPGILRGIAASGTNLFVVNFSTATIGEYTTSGATVNASLITGLNQPIAIALSGSNLFVLNAGNGTIGEYTTSGATVNASLVSGLHFGLGLPGSSYPTGIAVSGADLFISNSDGSVGEYTTSGATVNPALIPGSGVDDLSPIAFFGSNLFEALKDTIREYTTAGVTVNNSLVVEPSASFTGIVVVPEPSAWVIMASGAAILVVVLGRRLFGAEGVPKSPFASDFPASQLRRTNQLSDEWGLCVV